ncbi:MAG: deoxyribonuclease IV [Nitrospirota bacterium]
MPLLKRRLGVHTSISGGIHLSIGRAAELGCNTLQIFSHNPRAWDVDQIPKESVLKFRELRKSHNIDPVFIHTSYLINLASSDKEIIKKSIKLLIKEMDIADMLSADYVVLHTGSASQDTGETGRKRATDALMIVSGQKEWKAKLLLENTAGERGDISSGIKDLAEIIDKTNRPLIGNVCIDTCHAFQAGYDLSTQEGISGIADEIKRHLGIKSVKLIHLNDSKRDLNGRVDRHEHIGIGKIGSNGLGRFINHPAFADITLILETPKKAEDDDARNLKAVRDILLSEHR